MCAILGPTQLLLRRKFEIFFVGIFLIATSTLYKRPDIRSACESDNKTDCKFSFNKIIEKKKQTKNKQYLGATGFIDKIQ